jgi:methylmalonyl-CoA/ethylmalonyl-CoA epimerase
MLTRIDHVALVVEDLEKAIALYESGFQAHMCCRERNEAQGFEMAAFEVGGSMVELLAPTVPDSTIGRFLAKRGQGIHHVAFRVDNLREGIGRCQAKGLELVDKEPRRGAGGSRIAFLHPRSTMGALIELVEPGNEE